MRAFEIIVLVSSWILFYSIFIVYIYRAINDDKKIKGRR